MEFKSIAKKVAGKAGNIAKSAAKKTGVAANSAKLTLALKNAEIKLNKKFTVLGKLFYEQTKGTDVRTQIVAQIVEINEQKVVIAERKARIDERDSMIKAAREEFETKWANFDKLSIEEQKMLLDAKINFHHNGRFSHGQREMGPQCKTDKSGKQDCQKKPCKK